MKQYGLDLDLSEEILGITLNGDYTRMKKDKFFLPVHDGMGKDLYEGYRFSGDGCECLIAPKNKVRTVSCYYYKENYSRGCSFDYEGKVTSIV